MKGVMAVALFMLVSTTALAAGLGTVEDVDEAKNMAALAVCSGAFLFRAHDLFSHLDTIDSRDKKLVNDNITEDRLISANLRRLALNHREQADHKFEIEHNMDQQAKYFEQIMVTSALRLAASKNGVTEADKLINACIPIVDKELFDLGHGA